MVPNPSFARINALPNARSSLVSKTPGNHLGPDNHLWVTERNGKRVSRVHPATGQLTPAITIDEVSAPGGQDGLLGLALLPDLLKGKGNDFVYLAYTYQDTKKAPDLRVADPASPYRHLYGKIVRLRYDQQTQTPRPSHVTSSPGSPPATTTTPCASSSVPTASSIWPSAIRATTSSATSAIPSSPSASPPQKNSAPATYAAYEGKVMRFNLDGSIPADNPRLNGVVSHVWTYGHRNTQGLDFGPTGALYAAEHGPKTDDEIDILVKGGNYGWPHVAGFRDNKAYEYARWAEAKTPCKQLRFSDLAIHPDVPRQPESAFTKPMIEPIATLFTVPTGFNFADPACAGVDYICWPTVGISGVEYYGGFAKGIPGWDRVLLITTLKRGSLYILPLTPDGQKAAGKMYRYFQSENRYRDTAIHPDGQTIYVATDSSGLAEAASGGATTNMQDRGSILAFTYVGEGAEEATPVSVSRNVESLPRPTARREEAR